MSNQCLTSEGNHNNLWACWGLSSIYVVLIEKELIYQIVVRTSQDFYTEIAL